MTIPFGGLFLKFIGKLILKLINELKSWMF